MPIITKKHIQQDVGLDPWLMVTMVNFIYANLINFTFQQVSN